MSSYDKIYYNVDQSFAPIMDKPENMDGWHSFDYDEESGFDYSSHMYDKDTNSLVIKPLTLDQFKRQRGRLIGKSVVHFVDTFTGETWVFDSTEDARNRMYAPVLTLEAGEKTMWVLADDSKVYPTLEQFKQVLKMISKSQSSIWTPKE